MDELLAQFLIEAPELIQQAGDALLALEHDASNKDHLDEAFRAVHTLKGSVALFGMAPLVEALNAAEDILGAVRARRQPLESVAVDAVVNLLNRTDGWLSDIAASGDLPPSATGDCRALTAALRDCLGDRQIEAPVPLAVDTAWADALVAGKFETRPDFPMVALRYRPDNDCFFRGDDPLRQIQQLSGLVALSVTADRAWGNLADFDPFRCNLIIEALSTASLEAVKSELRLVSDQVAFVPIAGAKPVIASGFPLPATPAASDMASRSLRIDPARVDSLLDIVGELVVAKNGLVHVAAQAQQAADVEDLHRLILTAKLTFDRLVGDLHQAVMSVRLVPLRRTFERLPRLVRDTAGRLSKDVHFTIHGDTIEADKAIVDGLFEPMLHLLRNAIDHGIEDAVAREASGKAPQGQITLQAKRMGDLLLVEITDDGRGIDVGSVRRAARERGAMSGAAIDALSDEDAVDLIFMPGLSTRHDVSDISGRGVGMDAVRSAVEKLGGRVAMTSRLGQGATARMILPLSAVLTKVLTVRLGTELYGIAIDAVLETVRLPAGGVLAVGAGHAFVLRDRTVPLLHLRQLLDPEAGVDQATSSDTKVLIIEYAGDRLGIAVDAFADRLEIMVRPLTGVLSGMPGMRGSSLLGDGSVLIVLDLAALIP